VGEEKDGQEKHGCFSCSPLLSLLLIVNTTVGQLQPLQKTKHTETHIIIDTTSLLLVHKRSIHLGWEMEKRIPF